MTAMFLVAAYGTLFLLGTGVASLVIRRAGQVNIIEYLCLAWLCGVGSLSLLLAILGIFLRAVPLQCAVVLVAAIIFFAGWDRIKPSAARWKMPWPNDYREWTLAVIILAQISTIFYAAMRRGLGWDGLLVWEIKARYAFLNGGALPVSYFQQPGLLFSHPEYPLGLSLVELWSYLSLGEPNQFWVKLMFPVFYAAGVGLLGALTARLTGSRILGLGAAALIYFIPQISVGMGGAAEGYADFPLSVFFLAAIGYLAAGYVSPGTPGFPAFATMLAFLPWIKREGAVLWLIAALAGFFVLRAQKPALRLVAFLPGPVIIGAWQLFRFYAGGLSSGDFLPLSPTTLWNHLARFGGIFRGMLAVISRTSDWSCFWVLVAAALIYLAGRCRNLVSALLATGVVLPVLIYPSTYVFSSWGDHYLQHLATSAPRLLLDVSPLACLMIATAVAHLFSPRRLDFESANRQADLPQPVHEPKPQPAPVTPMP